MKLLLDECVTTYLKAEFTGHEILTVDEAGFKGLKNGELLRAAARSGFEVLVTVDQNLRYQQNLKNIAVAILILKARRTSIAYLKPLIPKALESLETLAIGDIVVIAK